MMLFSWRVCREILDVMVDMKVFQCHHIKCTYQAYKKKLYYCERNENEKKIKVVTQLPCNLMQ